MNTACPQYIRGILLLLQFIVVSACVCICLSLSNAQVVQSNGENLWAAAEMSDRYHIAAVALAVSAIIASACLAAFRLPRWASRLVFYDSAVALVVLIFCLIQV